MVRTRGPQSTKVRWRHACEGINQGFLSIEKLMSDGCSGVPPFMDVNVNSGLVSRCWPQMVSKPPVQNMRLLGIANNDLVVKDMKQQWFTDSYEIALFLSAKLWFWSFLAFVYCLVIAALRIYTHKLACSTTISTNIFQDWPPCASSVRHPKINHPGPNEPTSCSHGASLGASVALQRISQQPEAACLELSQHGGLQTSLWGYQPTN